MGFRLKDNAHFDLGDGFENDGPELQLGVEGPEGPTNTSYSVMNEAPGELSLLDEGIMESDPHCPEKWDMMGAEGDLGDMLDTSSKDDIHSLLDNSLEEVDDVLRKSGRLDANHSIRGQHIGSSGALQLSQLAPLRSRQTNARGTSAQGVGTFKSDPASSINPRVATALDALPQEIIGRHNNEPIVGFSVPCTTTGNTGDVPPIRRRARETPYIRAGDLTLTYTQAKLFGLTVPGSSPPSSSKNQSIALAKVLKATRTSTWCESRGTTADMRHSPSSSSHRRSRGRTYSVSRMEELATPLPSRGEREVQETGGSRYQEATFTWKRSRKAYKAMRDPACGYDFVRDGTGNGDQKEFLRRVEAYTSYSRAKLQATRAIQDYDARLNKMECPRCQNPQSYDEFASKKSKCPGCDLDYRQPITWKRKVWEQRNQRYMEKSEERRERVKKQATEELLGSLLSQTLHGVLPRQRVGKARLAFWGECGVTSKDVASERRRSLTPVEEVGYEQYPLHDTEHPKGCARALFQRSADSRAEGEETIKSRQVHQRKRKKVLTRSPSLLRKPNTKTSMVMEVLEEDRHYLRPRSPQPSC